MVNQVDSTVKRSIVKNCESKHLVVCFLRAERIKDSSEFRLNLFAKCPITGGVYSSYGNNYIEGKVLHFINDEEMDYQFKNCNLFDFHGHFESWDDVLKTVARRRGIKDMDSLKEIIKGNFLDAKFKSDLVEKNPVKRKILSLIR